MFSDPKNIKTHWKILWNYQQKSDYEIGFYAYTTILYQKFTKSGCEFTTFFVNPQKKLRILEFLADKLILLNLQFLSNIYKFFSKYTNFSSVNYF